MTAGLPQPIAGVLEDFLGKLLRSEDKFFSRPSDYDLP